LPMRSSIGIAKPLPWPAEHTMQDHAMHVDSVDTLDYELDQDHRFDGFTAAMNASRRLLGSPSTNPKTCLFATRLFSHLVQQCDPFILSRAASVIDASSTWIAVPGIQVLRNDNPRHYQQQQPRGNEVLAHFLVLDASIRDDQDWEIMVDFLSGEGVHVIWVIDIDDNVIAELDTIHNTRVVHNLDDKIPFWFMRGQGFALSSLLP
jgi:hypothetical protein